MRFELLIISSNFARVGELTNNIIDQLFFLQDVFNIQVECVNEYLKELMLKDFFLHYCYEVLIPSDTSNYSSPVILKSFSHIGSNRISYFLLLIDQHYQYYQRNILFFCFAKSPSFYPDLQKQMLSCFFPDAEHQAEGYSIASVASAISKDVVRRRSVSESTYTNAWNVNIESTWCLRIIPMNEIVLHC
jgi:hypothetical protein